MKQLSWLGSYISNLPFVKGLAEPYCFGVYLSICIFKRGHISDKGPRSPCTLGHSFLPTPHCQNLPEHFIDQKLRRNQIFGYYCYYSHKNILLGWLAFLSLSAESNCRVAASHVDQTPELVFHFSSDSWAECTDIYSLFTVVSKHIGCSTQSVAGCSLTWITGTKALGWSISVISTDSTLAVFQAPQIIHTVFTGLAKACFFSLTWVVVKKWFGSLSTEVSTSTDILSIPTSPMGPQLRLCWALGAL